MKDSYVTSDTAAPIASTETVGNLAERGAALDGPPAHSPPGPVAPAFGLLGPYKALGDAEAARRAWRDALDVLEQLREPDAERVHAKLGHLDTGLSRRD
ncbi:hypothetical protein AAH979_00035 [Plantactinospora sp. ZYX-F-223]|uniref:hypothetical protein n=1 Tax=Plantactinospora sp. ZYX-F-223 TaxID=3144103 RepID=UPI0031FCC40B